jgi:hypothetical protein
MGCAIGELVFSDGENGGLVKGIMPTANLSG